MKNLPFNVVVDFDAEGAAFYCLHEIGPRRNNEQPDGNWELAMTSSHGGVWTHSHFAFANENDAILFKLHFG